MRHIRLAAAGVAAAATLATGATGVVSAASTSSDTVGTSGITRTVFDQDRQNAAAKVLNTTTANVQAARKAKTFDQLLKTAGLTRETYHQKLKAELTSELESQGYTSSQVTIALQHREIVHLRHHDKKS